MRIASKGGRAEQLLAYWDEEDMDGLVEAVARNEGQVGKCPASLATLDFNSCLTGTPMRLWMLQNDPLRSSSGQRPWGWTRFSGLAILSLTALPQSDRRSSLHPCPGHGASM